VTPQSAPTVRPAPDRSWLSIGPASRLLGVDQDTLRRWADEGRIDAFTTPGGHRRFERGVVDRLLASRRPGARPLASMGATPERLSSVYRRSYSAADASADHVRTAVIDADREVYRQDGRRLVAALVAHLDADAADLPARERSEQEATALVDELARRLAGAGTSLTESVALFVAARRPFLAELAGLGRRRALDAARLAALYEDASGLLDRLLMRLIATHQAAG
jgi:excisionase family DNA binding protein